GVPNTRPVQQVGGAAESRIRYAIEAQTVGDTADRRSKVRQTPFAERAAAKAQSDCQAIEQVPGVVAREQPGQPAAKPSVAAQRHVPSSVKEMALSRVPVVQASVVDAQRRRPVEEARAPRQKPLTELYVRVVLENVVVATHLVHLLPGQGA